MAASSKSRKGGGAWGGRLFQAEGSVNVSPACKPLKQRLCRQSSSVLHDGSARKKQTKKKQTCAAANFVSSTDAPLFMLNSCPPPRPPFFSFFFSFPATLEANE